MNIVNKSLEASHLDAAALTEIKHGHKIVTNDY